MTPQFANAPSFTVSLGQLLFDYQTLFTGILAIAAAVGSGILVWRQLKQMSLQTNAALRTQIQDRIRSLDQERRWFEEKLTPAIGALFIDAVSFHETGASIDPEWAFNEEQNLSGLERQVKQNSDHRIYHLWSQKELGDILLALKSVVDALDAIHRPYSTNRDDPDLALSDEEWASVEDAGVKMEAALLALASRLDNADKALNSAYVRESTELRERLRKIDHDNVGG